MLKRQIVIIVINFNRRNLQNPIEVVIIIIGLAPVIDEMQKSPIEKRKRNLKTISPHSRGKREIQIPLPRLKRRKRNLEFSSSGERET